MKINPFRAVIILVMLVCFFLFIQTQCIDCFLVAGGLLGTYIIGYILIIVFPAEIKGLWASILGAIITVVLIVWYFLTFL